MIINHEIVFFNHEFHELNELFFRLFKTYFTNKNASIFKIREIR